MTERATGKDVGVLADLVAEEFADLPVTSLLLRVPMQRHHVMAGQFRLILAHAIEHGVVYTNRERQAVAAFIPSNAPPIHDYDERLRRATGPHYARFCELDRLLDGAHPKEPHHEHLALLAVAREIQGQGLGSQLLSGHLQRLDQNKTPSYVEASSDRVCGLYTRHGYVKRAALTFDGRAAFVSMWREPQPT